MFKIGDFSKLTFVSIRMLRYYDEINLFKPVHIDNFTNYRYYSAFQIPKLNKIVGLRNLGFKAEEIRIIINENDNQTQINLLQSRLVELEKQIHDDGLRLTKLQSFINNYNMEEKSMKYEAVIKEIPSYKVLSLRTVIETYNKEGELWGEFMQTVYKNNIQNKLVKGGMCYAMFFENDYKESQIHIEIGNEVSEELKDVENLKYKELPAIEKALSVLVTGSYEPNIQEGFNFVAKWLEENNHEIIGPSRTIYIKGPESEKNPDNYLTEIIIPIKKRG